MQSGLTQAYTLCKRVCAQIRYMCIGGRHKHTQITVDMLLELHSWFTAITQN